MSVLSYDPITGVFTWRESSSRGVRIGSVAGNRTSRGYIRITISGKKYAAHRLAWLFVHGELPDAEIDHINLNPSCNKISNLRVATRSQNNANRRSMSRTGGYKGVSQTPCGRFIAKCRVNGKQIYLGSFESAELAHKAYINCAAMIYGDFARG
jgi:hypothetical protein